MIYWKRKGFFYYADMNIYSGTSGTFLGNVTKKLDFISYHVIKWYHGKEKLEAMALKSFFDKTVLKR